MSYDLNEYHHKRHRLDFEDAKKHRVRERIGLLRRKLEQVDPLYWLTTDIMEHFEQEHLPRSLQGSLQRLFTRCPHEFLEFYKEMRAVADEMVSRKHQGRKAS